MVVLRLMSLVKTPPNVSNPSDSGVTSNNRMSFTSPTVGIHCYGRGGGSWVVVVWMRQTYLSERPLGSPRPWPRPRRGWLPWRASCRRNPPQLIAPGKNDWFVVSYRCPRVYVCMGCLPWAYGSFLRLRALRWARLSSRQSPSSKSCKVLHNHIS